MKFVRFVLVALSVFATLRCPAEMVDGIKAVVDSRVITYAEIQQFAAPSIDALRRQYVIDSPEFRQKLNDALTNSLELLIERQLILRDFDARGYRMPESYLDELVEEHIRNRFGDRVTLMKSLQADGTTFEQFRKNVQEQTIETFLRSKNVSQEIIVSPYQVENYYKAHQDDYKVEDQVKLRMIVLNKTDADDTNTVARAAGILDQIKAGASFADLATQYSQSSQARLGGAMDWVERSALRKEIADVAFTLKPGAVSDVIDTPDTCYLVLVEDAKPAHVRPIAEIREDVEKNLRTRKQQQLEQQWIESLKKKTFIRIFA